MVGLVDDHLTGRAIAPLEQVLDVVELRGGPELLAVGPHPVEQPPRELARQFVGSNQDVLEVGCGNGSFAKELRENGNRVSGVETLPPDAVEPVFERYLQSDLNAGLLAAGSWFSRLIGIRRNRRPGSAVADLLRSRIRAVANRTAALSTTDERT